MKEKKNFTSIEDFLDEKGINHNTFLVNSIKRYLNGKIYRDRLSNAGLKDGDLFLTRFFEASEVKKKLTQIIEDNQALTKKYNL